MNIQQAEAIKAANLPFGEGLIGGNDVFADEEATSRFAAELGSHTHEFTQTNLADCIDGRATVRLQRMKGGSILAERTVPQLPGGTFLAATKAAVAADASFIRDAKDIWTAYQRVATQLEKFNEEDAAHEGCGASNNVKKSVEEGLDPEVVVANTGLLLPGISLEAPVDRIVQRKSELLDKKFYSTWDPQRHAEYVASRYPENFSYLKTADDTVHGHYEQAIYVINTEGQGFAKNAFSEATGQQAFAVTLPKMRQLAFWLGASTEERERILVAFVDDLLHVSNGLVAEGMPVFTDAAEG